MSHPVLPQTSPKQTYLPAIQGFRSLAAGTLLAALLALHPLLSHAGEPPAPPDAAPFPPPSAAPGRAGAQPFLFPFLPHPGGHPFAAAANELPPQTPDGDFLPLPPFLHGMDLSESQKDQVFALLYADLPQARSSAKNLHKLHDALHRLGQQGKFDLNQAKQLSKQLADALAADLLRHTVLEAKLHDILSVEQKARLEQSCPDEARPLPPPHPHFQPHGDLPPPIPGSLSAPPGRGEKAPAAR